MCKNGFRHSILDTEWDEPDTDGYLRLIEHLPNEFEEDKEDEEFASLASRKIFLIASISFIFCFPVYHFFDYDMSYYYLIICLIMKKFRVL